MRIALVLHGWPPDRMGGTGLYVAALAEALRDRGEAVALLAPGIDSVGVVPLPSTGAGIEAFSVRGPAPRRIEQTWDRPEADEAFLAWARRWRPDVVHVHHLSGHSWGLLAAAKAAGARTVLTLHDYALPCGRGQLVDAKGEICPGPTPARCAACLADQLRLNPATRLAGLVLRRWPALRARAREAVATPRPRDQARLAARLEAARAAVGAADVLLAPSADLVERFVSFGFPRPERFELPLLRPVAPAPAVEPGPLRLLFASALLPTKGVAELLEAFAALPPGEATLTVAGPAPAVDGDPGFAARIRARAAEIPGVAWAGEQPPEAVPALLAAHDVLVLPSRWPENSPLVVREASAAGLRVVLGAVGGAAELAPEARRVDPRDPGALGAALRAELSRGRGRLPVARWMTPGEHAELLVSAFYWGR